MPLKRSPFRRSAPKPKRPGTLVPKTLGRSAVDKGPIRSKRHLALVRGQPCLVCGILGVHAHHVRIGLRTMGVRQDDTRAVPLCPTHHDELHRGNEDAFWLRYGIAPLAWCERFLREQARPDRC